MGIILGILLAVVIIWRLYAICKMIATFDFWPGLAMASLFIYVFIQSVGHTEVPFFLKTGILAGILSLVYYLYLRDRPAHSVCHVQGGMTVLAGIAMFLFMGVLAVIYGEHRGFNAAATSLAIFYFLGLGAMLCSNKFRMPFFVLANILLLGLVMYRLDQVGNSGTVTVPNDGGTAYAPGTDVVTATPDFTSAGAGNVVPNMAPTLTPSVAPAVMTTDPGFAGVHSDSFSQDGYNLQPGFDNQAALQPAYPVDSGMQGGFQQSAPVDFADPGSFSGHQGLVAGISPDPGFFVPDQFSGSAIGGVPYMAVNPLTGGAAGSDGMQICDANFMPQMTIQHGQILGPDQNPIGYVNRDPMNDTTMFTDAQHQTIFSVDTHNNWFDGNSDYLGHVSHAGNTDTFRDAGQHIVYTRDTLTGTVFDTGGHIIAQTKKA